MIAIFITIDFSLHSYNHYRYRNQRVIGVDISCYRL